MAPLTTKRACDPLDIELCHFDTTKNIYKQKKISKKMGGGMMMKPMGYKSGTSVMARGCKLGRKKPTKIM